MTEIDCVHCTCPIEVPDLLGEDDEFTCDDCGGVNVTSVEEDGSDAWFIECDGENCEACARSWCATCSTTKNVRRVYDCTSRTTRVEWYCYHCENAALWRLGRSVGK